MDSSLKYQQIYSQILDAIFKHGDRERNMFPSLGWVASVFTRAPDLARIERVVKERGSELDTDMLYDYENMLKVKDIAIKNGLMQRLKKTNGSDIYKTTADGSKFVQELSKNINKWNDLSSLNGMNFKQIRAAVQSAKSSVDDEWIKSLSPADQKYVDIYSTLSLKEFSFLKGLKFQRDGKNQYTARIETLQDRDPEAYAVLKTANFINEKDQLNIKLVDGFFDFLNTHDYAHLRSFNRSISSKLDRNAADDALKQNALKYLMDKTSPRSNDMALRVREYIETAGPCSIAWIVALSKDDGSRVRCEPDWEDLRLKDIVDSSKTLTNFGMAVAGVIKHSRGDTGQYNEKDIVNSRMPGKDDGRQQQRSKILQGRSKKFSDYMGRNIK